MVRFKVVLSLILVTLLLGIAASFYSFNHFIHSPLQDSQESIKYTLAPGTGSTVMVYQLKRKGVVTALQAQLLIWTIQYHGLEKSLKAGEYQFPLSITPEKLLEKFKKGDVVQYPFTIVEGVTFEELLKSVFALPNITKKCEGKSPQEIMTLLGKPDLSSEGQFFPETYFYTASMSDLDILKRAHQMMQKKLELAWHSRSSDVKLNAPYEALILASIIEKEAAVDDERELISGVFQRRLERNMRLQADPTVVYGLGKNYTGRLDKAQLKFDTPYNTYTRKGLPPSPIAMPGMKSILAAMHPDQGDALYFVARGDGTHHFSATLKEHNAAVTQYQLSPPATTVYQFGGGMGLSKGITQ